MLTIERLSQKEMCELARRIKAIRIGNNCSIYESLIHDKNKLVKTLQLKMLDVINIKNMK